MKTLFLACCVLLRSAVLLCADSEPDSAGSSKLERIQQEYERRRAAALRPVEAWYRAQLEGLRQNGVELGAPTRDAVGEALASWCEGFWQEDQPELTQALLATHWLWRSDVNLEGVPMAFHPDGTVDHIGMHGGWRITGPSEVTIRTEVDGAFVLRFNASLSAYEADRRLVYGQKIEVSK